MSKSLEWTLAPRAGVRVRPWRRTVARVLLAAVDWLDRWAQALDAAEAAPAGMPHLEFHAEAGAPEGALYVDGVRVGVIPGVRRL